MLVVLRLGCDGAGDVAGTQSQPRRQRREGSDEDGDDYFQDFFTCHNFEFLIFNSRFYRRCHRNRRSAYASHSRRANRSLSAP